MQPSNNKGMRVRPEEAEKLFKQVLSEFGVLLDLEISNGSEPASFIWGKVTLPKWYLSKSRELMLQTLRHEVGHRIVFPGKPDWEKLTMSLAQKNGVSDPETFANIVADWFVDYELLKKYGVEYYSRVTDAVKSYNGKDPRYWIFASVYQLMAEECGIKTPNIIAKAKRLCKDGDKIVEVAKEAYKIIRSNASLEGKIEQLAQLLKEWFHIFMKHSFEEKPKKYGKKGYVPAIRRLSPFIPAPTKLDPDDEKNPLREPQWLVQMLALYVDVESQVRRACRLGKVPAFLVELGIGYTGEVKFASDDVIVEAAGLSLYSRYVEALERVGASGAKVEELEQWTLGDLPHELRVEETLRVYGEVLPPVFSLKFSEREEPESGGRGGSVIIILDCSGSMAGSTMRVAKQAAFSILQEARKRGDEVYLIFFSGNAVPLPPGRSYDVYEKAVAAVVASGGTVLPRALRHALEYAAKAGKATTFIISDAGTSEVRVSARMVRELQKYGKVVFFWIGGAYGSYAEQWLRESGAKVYIVPFGRDFTEDALREALW
ncbi:MAG: VWA domain-containing protein [Deltaproteobacteria bacterium]|nr:VWA domain-containing protein [Deltaproteobacteria bacterium]